MICQTTNKLKPTSSNLQAQTYKLKPTSSNLQAQTCKPSSQKNENSGTLKYKPTGIQTRKKAPECTTIQAR